MTYVPPEYMCPYQENDEACSLRKNHTGDHYLVTKGAMADLQRTAEEESHE
jgi:hypothetical protein